jgi:hypothetical protein
MEIKLLTPEDMSWPLGNQDAGGPSYSCGLGSYPRSFRVDPYPAYPHNLGLVRELALKCNDVFPLPDARLGLWLFSHDFADRINGMTFEDTIYYREDGTDWNEEYLSYDGSGKMVEMHGQAITIVLAGKRIPIMPAMTKYLVTHEYGHAVFNYVTRRFGYKDHEKNKLEEKYMEIRGVTKYEKKYRGGHWHEAPGEIIANDFRYLFTRQQTDFWPHDCPEPSWHSPIGEWWIKAARIAGNINPESHIKASIIIL